MDLIEGGKYLTIADNIFVVDQIGSIEPSFEYRLSNLLYRPIPEDKVVGYYLKYDNVYWCEIPISWLKEFIEIMDIQIGRPIEYRK